MKKALYVFLIFTFCCLTLNTTCFNCANAESKTTVKMTIQGNDCNFKIYIPQHKKWQTGDGYFDYVSDKLNQGFSGKEILNFLSTGLGDAYYKYLSSYETPPINATMTVDKVNHTFIYQKGASGKVFDENEAALKLASALDGKKTTLSLVDKKPSITVDDLIAKTTLMATYKTDISSSPHARKHNIALACSLINGYVLESKAEFSFNSVVGKRTLENGFQNAKVIADGEYIDGVGGGVCQLATTLYNAVLLSGLLPTSVARHSYPPTYVEPSRDAMVSDYTDFKFINNTTSPIYIFAKTDFNNVYVTIHGVYLGKYDLSSNVVSTKSFLNVDKFGKVITANLDDYTLLSSGISGVQSELYIIFPNGTQKRIRTDLYKTKNAIYEKIAR